MTEVSAVSFEEASKDVEFNSTKVRHSLPLKPHVKLTITTT